jgi:hypothetical protein
LQREKQVRRHAVAMGFDMHGDAGLLAEPAPALQQGNASFQPLRPYVGLQVDVVGANPRHELQHRFQIVDVGRVALRLPDHLVRAKEVGDFLRERRIDEPDAGAVEAGVADHRELGLQRPLRFIRPPPLHRPERLQDAKLLRHRLRQSVRVRSCRVGRAKRAHHGHRR